MTLSDALKLLPGVRVAKARALLKDVEACLSNQLMGANGKTRTPSRCWVTVADGVYSAGRKRDGIVIGWREFMELSFGAEKPSGAQTVTPEGARLLLRLYEANALPMQGAKGDSSALKRYADSRHEQLEASAKGKTAQRSRRQAEWQAKVSDPSAVSEAEFSFGLLNQIFWHACGPSHHAKLLVGGIEVTKELSTHRSNLGKSKDHDVRFRWIGSDGAPHELSRDSAFKNNRANDPERGFGLGRKAARS